MFYIYNWGYLKKMTQNMLHPVVWMADFSPISGRDLLPPESSNYAHFKNWKHEIRKHCARNIYTSGNLIRSN